MNLDIISQKFFEKILNKFGIYVGFISSNLKLQFSSGKTEEFLCIKDINTKSLLDVFPELLGSEDAIEEIIKGMRESYEIKFIGREIKNGKQIYFNLHLFASKIKGYPIIIVVEDITPQSKHIRELQQSRNEILLLNEELSKKNKILERVNRQIEDELRSAQNVQKALFPNPVSTENFIIHYEYHPLYRVGGDFINFWILRKEILRIFIADIVGHGISASLFLSLLKAFTDRIVDNEVTLSPIEFLEKLRDTIIPHLTEFYYFTAIYGEIQKEGDVYKLSFGSAGHPPAILYRKKENDTVLLSLKGPIISRYTYGRSFCETVVELYKGDRLFLYTDGIIETTNPKGDMLSENGLSYIIREAYDPSLKKTMENIIFSLLSFKGKAEQIDDMLIAGIEVL